MVNPLICFGQQPCGIFPKRYLAAKIRTAQKLQQEIGGEIVFFYHDSDHDYRETITLMRDKDSGQEDRLNFLQENKIQKKYSPLYLKRIPSDWKELMLRQLPRFVGNDLIEIFRSVEAKTVADFCLEMYQKMRLLSGIKIVRSSDREFRNKASELSEDFFADVNYEGEIVRARFQNGRLFLHRGGNEFIELPPQEITKEQKAPPRDRRFAWMQSVLHCTHYVAGKSEMAYLDMKQFPEVQFIEREEITDQDMAFLRI